jgi:UDP-hydrolysing UDP-N-acetyl-D-glucosamine 2-epimerase
MTVHVAIVTGTRAEFGLLRPVMSAVRDEPGLRLSVVPAGSHLVLPGQTYREVKAEFGEFIAEGVPMQAAGHAGRIDDAQAVGRGIARFARVFERTAPDWVVVLGDRIEAFAAASAASVGGFGLAHVHGGDRAEGIADEAMRHAITKLAHLHFPATHASAQRILRMGEDPATVFVVGSPAIDGLDAVAPLDADAFDALGRPSVLLLLHPVGRSDDVEEAAARGVLEGLAGERVLALDPNLDAGHLGIRRALDAWSPQPNASLDGRTRAAHLPRATFIGLLKRLAEQGGVMVGNSSAALIEAAVLRLPALDIGPRQAGRERCANAVHIDDEAPAAVAAGVARARGLDRSAITHPYGVGDAGVRIARHLAAAGRPGSPRKRCPY